MALPSPYISVERISIPETLPAVIHCLIRLPNNPASLYLSVRLHTLIIYAAPVSTVYSIDLADLKMSLDQEDESALALKTLLETSTMIKVFFDARIPAKSLFDRCNIVLANKPCTEQSHIHEVQMMELALRRADTDREWLAGLDKCIERDSDLDVDKVFPFGLEGFDNRILHLLRLWKNYHGKLARSHGRAGVPFWIAMIREATQKRLEVSRHEKQMGHSIDGARSGWYKVIIEDERDSWDDDVMKDIYTGGEFLGGEEHWAKYRVL